MYNCLHVFSCYYTYVYIFLLLCLCILGNHPLATAMLFKLENFETSFVSIWNKDYVVKNMHNEWALVFISWVLTFLHMGTQNCIFVTSKLVCVTITDCCSYVQASLYYNYKEMRVNVYVPLKIFFNFFLFFRRKYFIKFLYKHVDWN